MTTKITADMEDGPIKKYHLIKLYGMPLRAQGYKPSRMTCKEIEAAIAKMVERAALDLDCSGKTSH